MRSLVDEAELLAKLRVEGPNHRVPLGDSSNLPCGCEPRMKPHADRELQKLSRGKPQRAESSWP